MGIWIAQRHTNTSCQEPNSFWLTNFIECYCRSLSHLGWGPRVERELSPTPTPVLPSRLMQWPRPVHSPISLLLPFAILCHFHFTPFVVRYHKGLCNLPLDKRNITTEIGSLLWKGRVIWWFFQNDLLFTCQGYKQSPRKCPVGRIFHT